MELALAGLATLAWALLDDGPLRQAALYLATTGWVLSARIGRDGVRSWRTYVAKLDAQGVPHPAFDAASPCGRAGEAQVRSCTGAP